LSQEGAIGQGNSCTRVARDVEELLGSAAKSGRFGRRHRNRDRAEIGSGHEGNDEIKARRVNEQRGLAEIQFPGFAQLRGEIISREARER
jgi:hypothetical protein